MIKLIIFDMDGVLVDIKDIHYDSLNAALNEVDKKYVISREEHLSTYDGLKTQEKLKLLTKNKNLPESLYSQIWKNKQIKTCNLLENLKPDYKILETLKKLKQDGFILAVASNSIRETIKNVLINTEYIRYIDFFLSNEDVTRSKPDTEIYLKCMIIAGVSPKDTIILEDSPIGIAGANNTGAKVLPVKNSLEVNYKNIKKHIDKENTMDKQPKKWINKNLNILIPMAGAGSRFEQAGYAFPKPLIPINDNPMIKVIVDNLNIDANYIFIVQKKHYDQYNLKYLLDMIAPKCKIVPIEGITEGAACTTLLAKEFIDNDNPLLLANSDQFIEWNSHDFMYSVENSETDGSILTFKSVHPKWSFAKLDDSGFVTEVAEKKPISDIATVGVYFWKKGSDYVKYAEQMISKNIRVNNEFYVCPVYNEAIQDNKKIKTYDIKNMWGLGTPEDLNVFLDQKIL